MIEKILELMRQGYWFEIRSMDGNRQVKLILEHEGKKIYRTAVVSKIDSTLLNIAFAEITRGLV